MHLWGRKDLDLADVLNFLSDTYITAISRDMVISCQISTSHLGREVKQ
jgi:hypothetical protein